MPNPKSLLDSFYAFHELSTSLWRLTVGWTAIYVVAAGGVGRSPFEITGAPQAKNPLVSCERSTPKHRSERGQLVAGGAP